MKKKTIILFIISFIIIILLLHSTPNLALRTHLVFLGYPIVAIKTGIIDDDYHNEVDKDELKVLNAKAYTLTKPPIEKATDGKLRNFIVKKRGFLYIAEYYGEW